MTPHDPKNSFIVPTRFIREHSALVRAPADDWLRSLPDVIGDLGQRWGFCLAQGDISYGAWALVVLVSRENVPMALKISHREVSDVASEASALVAWDGQGAVRLHDVDPELGALLLERLDPSKSLTDVDIWEASATAAHLLATLGTVEAPDDIPRLGQLVEKLADSSTERNEALGKPIPQPAIQAAEALEVELTRECGNQLVHGDFHYGNILAGTREPWLVVDPKPVAGDVEYAIPELLWTRVDELDGSDDLARLLDEIITAGSFDRQRAIGWTIVRAVGYWLWGLEHGLTEDPKRCAKIVERFRSMK